MWGQGCQGSGSPAAHLLWASLHPADAFAYAAGWVTSSPTFRPWALWCQRQTQRWLATLPLQMQRLEAAHFTVASVYQPPGESRKDGLGTSRFHHLQSDRVWHVHVLRHQVAPRPGEEGEGRGSAATRSGGSGRGRVGVGSLFLSKVCVKSGFYLSAPCLLNCYRNDEGLGLDNYSEKALDHVWEAERFSW